jgi:hypothetical protein
MPLAWIPPVILLSYLHKGTYNPKCTMLNLSVKPLAGGIEL